MKVEIIAITDRSGSMANIRDAAISGYNAFLDEQCTVPGEARVSHFLFDDRYETLHEAKDISNAVRLSPFNFVPRDYTALYDAIGKTLMTEGERIAKESWADKVIVTILTDGQENASKEYTAARVKEMIEHASKHNWHFVFLAANQDAFATGAQMGISRATTMNFAADAVGTQSAYRSMSSTTTSLRTTS